MHIRGLQTLRNAVWEMETLNEAITGCGENHLAHGANPCRTATNAYQTEGVFGSRTNPARNSPESQPQRMKFPKVIRHWKAEISNVARAGLPGLNLPA
jgi:hypothetical protein